MKFTLQQCDINGNPIAEPVAVNVDITPEELEAEMAIYCDCDYMERNPDANAIYVDEATIKDVGLVRHHGWLCPKCKKYVQVG